MSDRLGLIAGAGDLPLEIAQTVRDRGVLAIGYRGVTDPRLEQAVDELTWQVPGAIGTQLETLRSAGIGEVVLAGKIRVLAGGPQCSGDAVAAAVLLQHAVAQLGRRWSTPLRAKR